MALVKFEDEKRKRQGGGGGGGGGGDKRGDGGGDKGGGGSGREPATDSCPVTPIGRAPAKEDGGAGRYYFFDADGYMVGLTAQQMAQSPQLVALFGGEGPGTLWLADRWPQRDREGNLTGWFSARDAGAWLVAQCKAAGQLRADEPRRGVGVWRGTNGAIVHVGNEVRYYRLEADPRAPYEVRAPGFRAEGALWPAQAAVPPPGRAATAPEAREILLHLEKWNWRTPRGADVFFGLWAAGLLGAAIRWRAHGLVVGPPGAGKSSVLELYEAASPLAAIVNDYTEAGLRQSMTQRAAPLILDEAEGDAQGKLQAVVKLLRKMSGGEGVRALRGSSDGTPQRFDIAAPALLGGVLPPALEPQDETRITRLDLGPRLANGMSLPSPADLAEIRERAPSYWSRALAGLPRFEHNFRAFRAAIIAAGAPPRLADQSGTILAGRAMMLRDAAMSDEQIAAEVAAWIADGFIRTAEDLAGEQGPALCLAHLIQSAADLQEHGERPTIGQLVGRALGEEADAEHAARILLGHGMRLAPYPMSDPNGPRCLWVCHTHPRLRRLFADSRWSEGRWSEDLRNLPDAVVPKNPVHVGAKVRAVAIPLPLVLEGIGPLARREAPPSAAPPAPPDKAESNAPVGLSTQHCGSCFWYAAKDRRRGRCLSDHQSLRGAATARDTWCGHWRATREGDTSPPPSPPPSPPA